MALVVGNATYEHAPALPTSLNDAADVGTALQRLGFAVTRIDDADQGELRRGLHEFAMAAGAAETALVYYAGHAIAAQGRNFLVPVDARLSSSQDIEFETVPLELAERAVGRASDVRLIILDSSREGPFVASKTPDDGTEPITPGLARVDPSTGTLVAFAAKEGTVALEGEGRNSAYSGALLRHLEEPGLAVEQILGEVREAVLALTGGTQEPTVYGSLLVEGAYLVPQPAPSAETQATGTTTPEAAADDQLTAEKLAAERLFWESVKDSGDPAEIQTYLDQYPSGIFATLARARLKRLAGTISPVSSDAGSASEAGAPNEDTAETTPARISEQPPALDPQATEEALGLQREHRRLIQSGLALLGFDPGPANGVFGQRTRAAIKEWQASAGKVATGYLDVDAAKTLARRGIQEASRKGTEAPSTSEQPASSRRAAMDILARALQTAKEEVDDQSDRVRAIAEIGRVLTKAGHIRRAKNTSNWPPAAAHEAEYPVWDLGVVARIQAAAGDTDGAARTVELALAAAQREESEYSRENKFAQIAHIQADIGDAEGALTTAQWIVDEDIQDRTLFDIADAQAALGDAQGALATARQIRDEDYQEMAPSTLAEAQQRAGGIYLSDILMTYVGVDSEEDQARFDTAVAQVSAGDVRAALATAERIEENLPVPLPWPRLPLYNLASFTSWRHGKAQVVCHVTH